MSKNNLRIIFMGTPEFAVASLEALVHEGYPPVAVITAPDKPSGRGQKLTPSPVKICAQKHQLPVLQPTNLKSPAFLDELKSHQANLQIVVAFRMLPEAVWAMPTFGTFNLHASLLPQYRGAAPIPWAIINGETETGVTTFFLKQEIDTGSIVFQENEPIHPSDDAGTLYERLMHKGASLVVKTVRAIERGDYPSVPQAVTGTEKSAPKIFKETGQVMWDKPAQAIHNLIRGLSPYPGAWTVLNGKTFKLHQTTVLPQTAPAAAPGTIQTDQKTYLHIRAHDGWINVIALQPEGKRSMSIAEFFRGNTL
ncbi:MAG: methionyl-tRNA formyltransferase [Cyclobacteriaceae bacterium]|nr:methionyl-tRNA formyltransferase [Cyclobacteriaceae bacterium]